MRVVFGANEDFLRQIARLDLLLDASSDPTRPLKRGRPSLGAQVPVAYGSAGAPSLERARRRPRESPAGPTPTAALDRLPGPFQPRKLTEVAP
jgi:hypothetical protein